ncbi:hypothetical protein BMS3Abin04_00318 [bacterium BMS3Abin04]|nr:hypothetical protein BMS3Abin04_00318 [bacterium BMS3Abin04]
MRVVPSCGVPSSLNLSISYTTTEFLLFVYEKEISTSFLSDNPNSGILNPDFEKLAVILISLESVSLIFLVEIPKSNEDLAEYLTEPVKFPSNNFLNETFIPSKGENPYVILCV